VENDQYTAIAIAVAALFLWAWREARKRTRPRVSDKEQWQRHVRNVCTQRESDEEKEPWNSH
jgi:hypothetical protein